MSIWATLEFFTTNISYQEKWLWHKADVVADGLAVPRQAALKSACAEGCEGLCVQEALVVGRRITRGRD